MNDTSDTLPVVKGGQGRTDEEVADWAWMSVVLMIISGLLIALTLVKWLHG